MGDVWKAEDTKLGRTVALKLLASHLLRDEEARKRFAREAQAAAALSHPNVTTIYEIDEADGKTFLALEYVEGETPWNSSSRKARYRFRTLSTLDVRSLRVYRRLTQPVWYTVTSSQPTS